MPAGKVGQLDVGHSMRVLTQERRGILAIHAGVINVEDDACSGSFHAVDRLDRAVKAIDEVAGEVSRVDRLDHHAETMALQPIMG